MAFTRKKRRFNKKSRTRKVTRRRFKGKGRSTKKRRNPLKKVVMKLRRHPIMDRSSDRDHVVISQKFSTTGEVGWQQGTAALGTSTDGFLISMIGVSNAFQLPSPTVHGPLHYGVPVAYQSLPTNRGFITDGGSGSGTFDVAYNPDGLRTLLTRYQAFVVTSGVFTITVSQDSQGTAVTQGSTRFAVCGFPRPPVGGDNLQDLGNGHWCYPTGPGIGNSSLQSDANSMMGLLSEPNCRSKMLTPFAGTRTIGTIRYPFSINKYAPIGYYTNTDYHCIGPNGSILEMPVQTVQPRILVQFESNGSQQAQTYRFEMSMKWNVTAFQRNPVTRLA